MRKIKLVEILKYSVISIIVGGTLYPFYFLIKLSGTESIALGKALKNFSFTFVNYISIFQDFPFLRWMLNSIIITIAVALIKAFLDAFAGYAFARYKFIGSNLLFGIVLVTMMFPAAVTILPVFKMISRMGLTNTYIGIILPFIANPFGIFLMRQFIVNIPKSIDEAAIIDGCSKFGVFFKIILPLSRPGQVVVFIIHVMWTWTNLIWPLIIARREEMFTLTVGLATIPTDVVVDWGQLAAGAVLSLVFPFLLFLIVQKGFLEGITLGSVKE